VRGGGALAEEETRRAGLTMPHLTLGRVFRNSGARAELGGDESKNGARTGEERPRRSSGSNSDGGALRVRSEGERARERGLRGANGSEGEGGRSRALLVADRDASTLPHARHAAARLCRRATAARRGRPRAGASAGASAGAGKGRARVGRAGLGQRARSEAAAC